MNAPASPCVLHPAHRGARVRVLPVQCLAGCTGTQPIWRRWRRHLFPELAELRTMHAGDQAQLESAPSPGWRPGPGDPKPRTGQDKLWTRPWPPTGCCAARPPPCCATSSPDREPQRQGLHLRELRDGPPAIGIVGLLLATIFSAGMSSTSAELSALATTSTVDVVRMPRSDAQQVKAARLATVVFGLRPWPSPPSSRSSRTRSRR